MKLLYTVLLFLVQRKRMAPHIRKPDYETLQRALKDKVLGIDSTPPPRQGLFLILGVFRQDELP